MKKIYTQELNGYGWEINFQTLQKIRNTYDIRRREGVLGLEEIEEVILTLEELGYLKIYNSDDNK